MKERCRFEVRATSSDTKILFISTEFNDDPLSETKPKKSAMLYFRSLCGGTPKAYDQIKRIKGLYTKVEVVKYFWTEGKYSVVTEGYVLTARFKKNEMAIQSGNHVQDILGRKL